MFVAIFAVADVVVVVVVVAISVSVSLLYLLLSHCLLLASERAGDWSSGLSGLLEQRPPPNKGNFMMI